jgi:outer membrane protein
MQRSSIYVSLLTFCLMAFASPLMAFTFPFSSCCCDSLDLAVEARVAYYHPTSKKVRHIYSEGVADYQLEISKGLGCNWRVWAGVSGFSKEGRSIGFHNRTRLSLVPVNLGVKYVYPIMCDTKLYVGAAVCYSFLNIKDHSYYVHEHTSKGNWGGLIQLGLYYNIWDCLYLDVFADYYFQRFHFSHSNYSYDYYVERHNLDMSGYKVGAGLGFSF